MSDDGRWGLGCAVDVEFVCRVLPKFLKKALEISSGFVEADV